MRKQQGANMMINGISSLEKISEREKSIKKDIQTRNVIRAFADVSKLPKELQTKWETTSQSKGDTIYFDKENVIFKAKPGYIFSSLPELLFACYIYDFYNFLFDYYDAVMTILHAHSEIKKGNYKEVVLQAKSDGTGPLVDIIKNSDITDEDKEKLLEFATDYKAWNGGKSIDRENDFYISPIYSVLNIVQSKSGIHSFFPYLKNKELYKDTKAEVEKIIADYNNRTDDLTNIDEDSRINEGSNVIYYGAPGTGKSYSVNNIVKEKYADYDAGTGNKNVFRVTLHPEYTYSDFVGQLLPYSDNSGHVDYRFIPGIFTNALSRAYHNPSKNIYLILEEMSRANVAAVFGDLFQLLDRKNGVSEYGINNSDIAKVVYGNPEHTVVIPSNMTIFGTVNTSDQNVFVMDTAFKRRFDWKYVSTNAGSDSDDFNKNNNPKINLGDNLFWNWRQLYQALNKFIVGDLGLSEDKQIGPYFIKFEGADEAKAHDLIKDKLLQYLWEDVSSTASEMYSSNVEIFKKKSIIPSFSSLYEKFDNNEQVFSNEFLHTLGVENEDNSTEN